MYIIARHTDSKTLYTDNNTNDFRTHLDTTLQLSSEYVVGVKEIFLTPVWSKNKFKPGQIYLYCDIVEDSYVGGKRAPLLRVINIPVVRSSGFKPNHYQYDTHIFTYNTTQH